MTFLLPVSPALPGVSLVVGAGLVDGVSLVDGVGCAWLRGEEVARGEGEDREVVDEVGEAIVLTVASGEASALERLPIKRQTSKAAASIMPTVIADRLDILRCGRMLPAFPFPRNRDYIS